MSQLGNSVVSSDGSPTIFVVDDEPDIRDALRLLFKSMNMKVETFGTAQSFLKCYDPSRPGCLILDVRIPGMSGPELQEKLRANRIDIPVIIITGHGDVPTTVRTMRAGAIDVIEKPFNDQALLDRVQQALQKDQEWRKKQIERDSINARLSRLTPRESEVMKEIVKGKPNKKIATTLGVSTRTVEIHRARVMEKMEAGSLSNLVQLVISVEPDQHN